MALEKVIETDVLVIGGGMAGIFAAIKARERGRDVVLADKGYVSKSGATAFAGGYFMAFNNEWGHNLVDWVNQVSTVGEYMVDRKWAETVLKDSYARYQDLLSWGVEFVKENDGNLVITRRGVLECFNMWRRKYHPVMRNQALKVGVKIVDRIVITDLLKQDGRIVGAVGFHSSSGNFHVFKAKATVIAAGQGGFKQPGLPSHFWTGDGEGMAYRAGAEISGKEFGGIMMAMAASFPAWRGHGMTMIQFHKLINSKGEDVPEYPMGIDSEIHAGRGPIYWNLDAATPERVKAMVAHQKITVTTMEAERAGLDVTRGGKFPFVGGAGWLGASVQGGAGGLWPIDENCAASLPGLYAAGDSCSNRQLGAVYPAGGFALTNAAVTGARAGLGAAEYASNAGKIITDKAELAKLKDIAYEPMERKGGFGVGWVTQQLLNTVSPYYVWRIKHGKRLQAALTMVMFIRNQLIPKMMAKDAHELRMAHETVNIALNAEMMLRAALYRTESRGTHYREDYPRRDDPSWLVWVKVKNEQGEMKLWKEPIPKAFWPDLSKSYEQRYPARLPGELELRSAK